MAAVERICNPQTKLLVHTASATGRDPHRSDKNRTQTPEHDKYNLEEDFLPDRTAPPRVCQNTAGKYGQKWEVTTELSVDLYYALSVISQSYHSHYGVADTKLTARAKFSNYGRGPNGGFLTCRPRERKVS